MRGGCAPIVLLEPDIERVYRACRSEGDTPLTDWKALRSEIFETFTPGPPINELELFAGRRDVIQRLQDITIERGRHAIIFGERGVGKTSLANIFHKDLNVINKSNNARIRQVTDIFINADSKDSFDSLWRKVFRRMTRPNSVSTVDLDYPGPIEPDHIVLEMERFSHNELPIIIIDEYDRVEDEECRVLMTDVIKALTTVKTNPTIVLVGVADNILHLVQDHGSISRNLVQIPMKRMSPDEIRDIVTTRFRRLRMKITSEAIWRIVYFSSGLPFYTHSLGKYAALSAISANKIEISEETIFDAIDACMADVDYSVTESYTRATEKIYRKGNIFLQVLAACALAETNDLGQFTASAVEAPLSGIMGRSFKVSSFAFHLNEMCLPERGGVLCKTGERRTYQYHFSEAAMQPYVIMKSLKEAVISKDVFQQYYVRRQMSLSV